MKKKNLFDRLSRKCEMAVHLDLYNLDVFKLWQKLTYTETESKCFEIGNSIEFENKTFSMW